ncbi:MAG: glycoside hydrolase family 9 protein [Bacteroidales bacterium]|nr:glycoside hydrolase family 9 protein [Bacteroidales bacterium]
MINKTFTLPFIGRLAIILIAVSILSACEKTSKEEGLKIGDQGYFEMPGLNVLVFNNSYSEGHQGGVEIIQHGTRVATNGTLTLSPSPGQWQPVPKLGEGFQKIGCSPQQIGLFSRVVDSINNEISMPCSYPDEGRSRKGFNPIIYPDLDLKYNVKVKAEGKSFTITVDMENPIPDEWVGRIGYNFELFPGDLYGKTFFMDDTPGTFPRQANGPTYQNSEDEAEAEPLAKGNKLIVAPESEEFRITIESNNGNLELLDGSLKHNNGWFVVRSLVPAGATKGAIQWKITPNVIPNWKSDPIVHITQVGYHPKQEKVAYIELDKTDKSIQIATLLKLNKSGEYDVVKEQKPELWGQYLRYKYVNFNFSEITEPGMYKVKYGDVTSNIFNISPDVYKRHVWQPTLEYFIPAQMCHMRVNQKYRVWHGACHLDDALMAPLNIAHFDGYNNTAETSTLSPFKPLEHVPGVDVGGWHDAGDYDLRIESQAWTVIALAHTYEEFGITYDETFIDQKNRHVEIHHPDGKPDLLQQVEHGVLTILGGYHQLGRLYRGIIAPSLRQYVHLGDAATHTDNKIFNDPITLAKAAKIDELWYKKVANRYSNTFDPEMNLDQVELYAPELDDRLLFTETDPDRQLLGAASLAIASRVLKFYDEKLSQECLKVAEELWVKNKDVKGARVDGQKLHTLAELILTTNKEEYKSELCALKTAVKDNFDKVGWSLGRISDRIECPEFKQALAEAAASYKPQLDSIMTETPFGSPLEDTEILGFKQYFLNQAWPDLYGTDHLFNVLNYLLGCRPGYTTNSLVSGVGVNSPTVAYGTNRADWSYIPGGTFWNAVNLVSPDYAEDKVWPFMWQEREYIITAPCFYMFSVIAADNLLENM